MQAERCGAGESQGHGLAGLASQWKIELPVVVGMKIKAARVRLGLPEMIAAKKRESRQRQQTQRQSRGRKLVG